MDFRLFVGLGILACVSDFVQGSCPPDVRVQVEKCTESLGFDIHSPHSHKLVTNINKASEVCRSGKLSAAVDCMESLAKRCQDHASSMELNMMFQAKNLKKSISLMCENIEYLVEEDKCLADGKDEMMPCVEKEIKKYETDINLKALSSKSSGSGSAEEKKAVLKLSCRYVDSIEECVTTHTRKHCPKKFADLLKNILMGFIPPVCSKEKMDGTGTTSKGDDTYKHVGDGNGNGSARNSARAILQVLVSVSLGVWMYFF